MGVTILAISLPSLQSDGVEDLESLLGLRWSRLDISPSESELLLCAGVDERFRSGVKALLHMGDGEFVRIGVTKCLDGVLLRDPGISSSEL